MLLGLRVNPRTLYPAANNWRAVSRPKTPVTPTMSIMGNLLSGLIGVPTVSNLAFPKRSLAHQMEKDPNGFENH